MGTALSLRPSMESAHATTAAVVSIGGSLHRRAQALVGGAIGFVVSEEFEGGRPAALVSATTREAAARLRVLRPQTALRMWKFGGLRTVPEVLRILYNPDNWRPRLRRIGLGFLADANAP